MPDNDIRAKGAELMASAEYTRLTELPGMSHPAWAELPEISRAQWRESFARHVAALGDLLTPDETLVRLLGDLIDPDPCHHDHHGGCQAHGYLSLEPGEMCPHEEAKRLLAETAPSGSVDA